MGIVLKAPTRISFLALRLPTTMHQLSFPRA